MKSKGRKEWKFDIEYNEADFEKERFKHLNARTRDNYASTMRKWISFMEQQHPDMEQDLKGVPVSKVCCCLVQFLEGWDKNQQFTSVKFVKNIMTHIEKTILAPIGMSYKGAENGMSQFRDWFKGFKKLLSTRIDQYSSSNARSKLCLIVMIDCDTLTYLKESF